MNHPVGFRIQTSPPAAYHTLRASSSVEHACVVVLSSRWIFFCLTWSRPAARLSQTCWWVQGMFKKLAIPIDNNDYLRGRGCCWCALNFLDGDHKSLLLQGIKRGVSSWLKNDFCISPPIIREEKFHSEPPMSREYPINLPWQSIQWIKTFSLLFKGPHQAQTTAFFK